MSAHNIPLHAKQIANLTNQDPVLSRARNLVGEPVEDCTRKRKTFANQFERGQKKVQMKWKTGKEGPLYVPVSELYRSTKREWQPETTALFDIRIIQRNVPTYLTKCPEAVLKSAEREKKAKYSTACEDCLASFTLLCISVDCLVGADMKFLKDLA
uniref:Uncharacterized protein n=1 Tax=Amphimedon queenslandica TaxID=400682 RepID=A0A1X7U9X0_AMPQE